MSGDEQLYHAELMRLIRKLIADALEQHRTDLTQSTGTIPPTQLPPPSGGSPGAVVISTSNPADVTTGSAAPGSSGEVSDAGHIHHTAAVSAAPTDATYITQTANGTLTNEQALSALATGLLKNTTSTGVLSIADASDLPSHDHTGTSDGGKLTNDDHDGYSLYEEISAPSTPAGNTARFYAKDKGGTTELFYKNDGGTERDLSLSGSGATHTWDARNVPASPATEDDEFADASLDGKWTEWDVGSVLTVTEELWGLNFAYNSGSYKAAGIYQACPVGDWVFETRVAILGPKNNWFAAGLMLGQDLAGAASTSDVVEYSLWSGASAAPLIQADLMSDYQTFSTTYFSDTMPNYLTYAFLRIRRISTTLYFDYCYDPEGIGWFTRTSQAQPFTPSHVGVICVGNNSQSMVSVYSHFRHGSTTTATVPIAGSRI
jgi:hypothetical protein